MRHGKKLLMFSLILLVHLISSECYSAFDNPERKSKNSVYVLGYGGLLTIGYQRLITDWMGINVSAASIALLHEDLRDGFAFPVHLSFYPLGQEHRLFFDFGVNFITKGKSNPMFDFYDGFNMPLIFGIGYNYHPNDGGLFLKLGPGMFLYEPKSNPSTMKPGLVAAVALGYAF